MLHLKELVKQDNNLDTHMYLCNINEIVGLIRNKNGFAAALSESKSSVKDNYIFSNGAVKDSLFLDIIKNCDFNEYIIESIEFAGTFIDSEELKLNIKSDYLFLYDDEITLMIPITKVKQADEQYYKIYPDKLIVVKEYLLQKCDGCSIVSLKDILFNLYPEINTGLNKKYEDFKGMVCAECLERMEKGLPLKNEEELKSKQGSGDISYKIDEFSSIEDIMKFCGMNNRQELERELKNKIYH